MFFLHDPRECRALILYCAKIKAVCLSICQNEKPYIKCFKCKNYTQEKTHCLGVIFIHVGVKSAP